MTQEDKDLLLKDLCARLPYGVILDTPDGKGRLNSINLTIFDTQLGINVSAVTRGTYILEDCKPYLFPMSSMTHEQRKELIAYAGYERREEDVGYHSETYYYDLVGHENILYPNSDAIDWLDKNHFDYRGLIPKGLANDATGLNIY